MVTWEISDDQPLTRFFPKRTPTSQPVATSHLSSHPDPPKARWIAPHRPATHPDDRANYHSTRNPDEQTNEMPGGKPTVQRDPSAPVEIR